MVEVSDSDDNQYKDAQSYPDLRNISCTMLTSKVYESFLLNWLNEQTGIRRNQYGGVNAFQSLLLMLGH